MLIGEIAREHIDRHLEVRKLAQHGLQLPERCFHHHLRELPCLAQFHDDRDELVGPERPKLILEAREHLTTDRLAGFHADDWLIGAGKALPVLERGPDAAQRCAAVRQRSRSQEIDHDAGEESDQYAQNHRDSVLPERFGQR